MGAKHREPCQLSFNGSLRVDFQGSRVTSDGGLILVRQLDERLGFSELIAQHVTESRRGKYTPRAVADLLRQSVYSRLAGDEDVNGAERVSQDPTFRITSLSPPSWAVVRFYNKRGTAERALLGATGGTQEGKFRGNASKGGKLVYAHTKLGDHNRNPSLNNRAAGLDSPTAREREGMGLVVSELLNKQIAADLGASEITRKRHRAQVMQQMGAESLTAMVRMAEKLGMPSTTYGPEYPNVS